MDEPPKDAPRSPFDFTEFVCTCDEERLATANAMLAEVAERLDAGTENLRPSQERWGGVVSRAVMSLEFDYDATITQIGCDQWFGVWAKAHDGSFSTFVQCDRLEDGFAMTWKAFADRAGA